MNKQAWTAYHELKLDVPVLRSEIDGDKVTLHLYGGQVVTWQPSLDTTNAQPAPKTKPKPKSVGVDRRVNPKPK